eukprot:gnl/TRDRNA2_/TRDRNA2_121302_c1_seq1.p2 gnl/TRDRNA2_/TRDRNA2_121302_c1~~gnl/TRDRNA2_/TRDRNA2_121302_c1_seq1.p2  ORF type:complete len:108 (+),score=5.67 gnl/TRDRNA2_/TRDRNA2_121302_c1_seq1:35-358(+)
MPLLCSVHQQELIPMALVEKAGNVLGGIVQIAIASHCWHGHCHDLTVDICKVEIKAILREPQSVTRDLVSEMSDVAVSLASSSCNDPEQSHRPKAGPQHAEERNWQV